jgi:hypothetical protein
MIKNYVVYNTVTGEIVEVGAMYDAYLYIRETPTNAVLVTEDSVNQSIAYVLDGAIVNKEPLSLSINKTQIIADGADTATVSNIPTGTKVTWPDGLVEDVTDGLVEFAVDLAGLYTFKFTAVPYLDQEVTIEAVPTT